MTSSGGWCASERAGRFGVVVAAEGDGVAELEGGGRGGVGVIAGEPEVAVGVREDDPFAAFHAGEIAAGADAEFWPVGGEFKPGPWAMPAARR